MFGHKRIPSREGGAEVVVANLSTRMAALGHEVVCYNRGGHHVSGAQFDSAEQSSYRGVRLKKVLTIDKRGLAAVTASVFAAISAAFSRAQVVHIHAEGPAFMCWLPKLFFKRVVVTVHGLDWQRAKWNSGLAAKYIRAGERMAVRFADEIIVLSRSVHQYFADTYGRKTVFIPNGVERPQPAPADEITRRFGLKKDGYILFLGRLVPEKGIHYLIEAFKNVETDKTLVIAGGASDSDDYAKHIKEMAREDGRVMFTGFVEGDILRELYSNAYIYVHPSDMEGMPLCLLEAMSYGSCCLVSDIPECTEVVEDKAEIFKKSDTEALRSCIQRLLDDPEQVLRRRNGAQEYICRKYDWDEITKQTLELYK